MGLREQPRAGSAQARGATALNCSLGQAQSRPPTPRTCAALQPLFASIWFEPEPGRDYSLPPPQAVHSLRTRATQLEHLETAFAGLSCSASSPPSLVATAAKRWPPKGDLSTCIPRTTGVTCGTVPLYVLLPSAVRQKWARGHMSRRRPRPDARTPTIPTSRASEVQYAVWGHLRALLAWTRDTTSRAGRSAPSRPQHRPRPRGLTQLAARQCRSGC